jgi:hypothetical protein
VPTFDALVDRLKTQFDVDTSVIAGAVNERQKDMVAQAKWRVTQGTLATTVAGQNEYTVPAAAVNVRQVQVAGTTYNWVGDEEIQRATSGTLFSAGFDTTGSVLLRLYPTPDTSGLNITAIESVMPADATYGSATALAIPDDLAANLRAGARATLLREVSERPDLSTPEEQIYQDGVRKLRARRNSLVGPRVTRARVEGYDFVETSGNRRLS